MGALLPVEIGVGVGVGHVGPLRRLGYTRTVTSRATLHDLVDEIPEGTIDAAQRWLAALRDDPVARAFASAELDDEPLSENEARLLDERWASARQGNIIPHEEVLRMLELDASRSLGT